MPPLKPATLALVGLFAAGLSIPVLLVADGSLRGLDVDELLAEKLPPPPTLTLLSPEDGQGVGPTLRIQGEAASQQGLVTDVQWRLDGGPWASLPEVVAGLPLVPFVADVALPPGDHLVEVRAYDGEAFSIVSRADVRSAPLAPPTVRILAPADGDGLAAGEVIARGTVEGRASTVVVRLGDEARVVAVKPDTGLVGTWSVALPLPAGQHEIVAQAGEGLPRAVRVAARDGTPPPTLHVTTPIEGASFGSGGDPACPAVCVLFSGLAPGADQILVSLDGGEPAPLASEAPGTWTRDADGAWTWALPMGRLLAGEHRAEFTPVAADGTRGVPQDVSFLVRVSTGVGILGDDAPRFTNTTLRFTAEGDRLVDARWLLDGKNVAKGPAAQVRLLTPGHHTLDLHARDAQGRAAGASLPLYALNQPPTATLTVPSAPVVGAVDLRAAGEDPDGRVIGWRWDFGDGRTATSQSGLARHDYGRSGVFRVNATPIDDQGLEGAPAAGLVTILNGAPTADFTWAPASPRLGEPVTFTDASHDPEGALLSRSWDFGDGAKAEGPVVTHAFGARGLQQVTLTVTDADGGRVARSRAVEVANLLATVAFVHEPQALQTGVEALFLDRSVKEDGALVSWSWDFGHECPNPCDPLYARHANGTRVLHAFPAPGDYTVNLTVTDDLGATATFGLPVTVHDSLPDVREVQVTPAQPTALEEVRFKAVARDAEDAFLAYEWRFGDGARSYETQPTHRYDRSGVYAARVLVTDAAGQVSELPFLVTVRNAKPNATLHAPVDPLVGRVAVLEARATDDGALVRYRFDADGDGVADCDGPAPRCAFTFPSAGAFVANVAVVDDEGASVVAELPLDVALPPEDAPRPTALLESPLPGESAQGRILLTGTAAGPRGVERVEVQLRNGSWTLSVGRDAWMLATGNASWRLYLDTRTLPDGDFTLAVRATDAQGLSGVSTFPLRVQNGARPSLLSLEILDAPDAPLRADHDLRGSAWHPDGPVSLRHRLDEGPWRDVPGDPVGWTLTLSPTELGAGWHDLRIEARRGLDERREETLRFRVADPPPALVVDEPPTPVAYGLLAASGRLLGEGKVQWRLDHDVWRDLPPGPEWRLSYETMGVQGGNHTLWLRPVTLDGLAEGEPTKYRVRVLNPPATNAEKRLLADVWQDPDAPQEIDLERVAQEKRGLPLAPWTALLGLAAGALLAGRFAPPRSRL